MKLFARREAPPADILAVLPRHERVVSWADADGDRIIVATPGGLWWPETDGPRMIGWQYVNKAVWRDGVLAVTEAEVVDDMLLVDRPTIQAVLTKPRDLPPTVRKRVEANVVRSELLSVPGGVARFVARKVPGRDGLVWWARIEADTPDTEQVRSAVSARLAVLRAEWEDARRLD